MHIVGKLRISSVVCLCRHNDDAWRFLNLSGNAFSWKIVIDGFQNTKRKTIPLHCSVNCRSIPNNLNPVKWKQHHTVHKQDSKYNTVAHQRLMRTSIDYKYRRNNDRTTVLTTEVGSLWTDAASSDNPDQVSSTRSWAHCSCCSLLLHIQNIGYSSDPWSGRQIPDPCLTMITARAHTTRDYELPMQSGITDHQHNRSGHHCFWPVMDFQTGWRSVTRNAGAEVRWVANDNTG